MSNSYIDKYQQIESSAAEYMEDINQLTADLRSMAAYMNQYDLDEVRNAIGDFNTTAFENINASQVCDLMADEQTRQALQSYINLVTEASKDVENGYELKINIDPNNFMINLAEKRQDLYNSIAIEDDPNMLMFIESYRYAEMISEEAASEKSSKIEIANMIFKAYESQGIQKNILASNAVNNIDTMLLGLEYAIRHGAIVDSYTFGKNIENLMLTAASTAHTEDLDAIEVVANISMKAYERLEQAKAVHEELLSHRIELEERLRTSQNVDEKSHLEEQLRQTNEEFARSERVVAVMTENVTQAFKIAAEISEKLEGSKGMEKLDSMIMGHNNEEAREMFNAVVAERHSSHEHGVEHSASNDDALEF